MYTNPDYYQRLVEREDPVGKTKPVDIGTRAETKVVNWAKAKGFWSADRLTKKGIRDRGDVRLTDKVMVQVKSGYTDGRSPTDYQIGNWLEALDTQKFNGQWEVALLCHHRHGARGGPDAWRWFMDGRTFGKLTCDTFTPRHMPIYVQLQGYMVPELLKSAGY